MKESDSRPTTDVRELHRRIAQLDGEPSFISEHTEGRTRTERIREDRVAERVAPESYAASDLLAVHAPAQGA